MPSTWSSRLLSNGSSSNTTPSRGSPSLNKPLPRPPDDYLDPPTLHHERAGPCPARSRSSPRREHARSSSNPLPKFFGRKKSTGNLQSDADVPLDDELVPVLDEHPEPVPSRVISGKKSKSDDDGKIARRCMCCDSKVKVPKELFRFRCLCCLTVNDLKPSEEQSEEDKSRPSVKRTDSSPRRPPPGVCMPLSVERTRAIIDRCLTIYLEARCTRREDSLVTSGQEPAKGDLSALGQGSLSVPIPSRNAPQAPKQVSEGPLSLSPTKSSVGSEKDPGSAPTSPVLADVDQCPGTRGDDTPFQQEAPGHGSTPAASVKRKPVPAQPNRKPPPPPVNVAERPPPHRLGSDGTLVSNGNSSPKPPISPRLTAGEIEQRRQYDLMKSIFRPLENYIVASYGNYGCLNSSFSTVRPAVSGRTRSESNIPTPPPELVSDSQLTPVDGLSELDAKTLLLGDIGENGSWWAGRLDRNRSKNAYRRKNVGEAPAKMISSKSPNINWNELSRWYDLVHSAGHDWRQKTNHLKFDDSTFAKTRLDGNDNIVEIESELAEARDHAIRALLKTTENILKRPTRPIKEPEDLRFLLIIMSNPSLYPSRSPHRRGKSSVSNVHKPAPSGSGEQTLKPGSSRQSPKKSQGGDAGRHTGLLKRIFGILANAPEMCHRYLVGWFSRLDERHFVKTVDLVASFVTHRIARRSSRPRGRDVIQDGGLIPDLSGSAMSTSAQLHSAMGLSGSMKARTDNADAEPDWTDDWQMKAAAKVMSILFAANNIWQSRPPGIDGPRLDPSSSNVVPSAQGKARRTGQLLHTSSFYNTLLDYQDLIADFKVWETKRDKFAFCQYPLFLSMGAKIKILEYDARRQMEIKAREAYFDQVIRQRAIDGHFHLRVRRECMLEDSFRQISEAVGTGQEELKKGLRVHFSGEEGVDAGGLRKEWFLLLVRDIFNPQHGMFVYDEESHTCYFNPNSFETSDQYYLVGALLGLAIYNSTILDVALPPFAFRKLLASAPTSLSNLANISTLTGTKGQMTYTIADLAEFRPSLAAGLQLLLDFEGDVEATYCRDFVAPVEIYGTVKNIPLIPNGEKTPVTNTNRYEFVDAYVRYLLDTAVARQFEPFKRGFFTVCAGNALSLFRAEEIELLIRGSDEALDVDSLRAVAVYENWRDPEPPHAPLPTPADHVPVIGWFWELFAAASPSQQRKLLTFITGSDRIPAVGATSLILRIVAGGDGRGRGGREETGRFPVARTCFNMLILWRYESREQLEEKLWRAVEESEGFGLK